MSDADQDLGGTPARTTVRVLDTVGTPATPATPNVIPGTPNAATATPTATPRPKRFVQSNLMTWIPSREVADVLQMHHTMVSKHHRAEVLVEYFPADEHGGGTKKSIRFSGTATAEHRDLIHKLVLANDPHVGVVLPPAVPTGNGNGKSREKFTHQEKLRIAEAALTSVKPGLYFRANNVKPSNGQRWIRDIEKLRQAIKRGDGTNTKNRGLHKLTRERDVLVTTVWIELRESYYSVNLTLLSNCLQILDPTWAIMQSSAQSMFFKGWLDRHKLSVRKNCGIHQITPANAATLVAEFHARLQDRFVRSDVACIVVGDETQVLYNQGADTTIVPVGSTHHHVVAENGVDRKEGCTVFLSAMSCGPDSLPTLLEPQILFKGSAGVYKKAARELQKQNVTATVDTTASGWQTRKSFVKWIGSLPNYPNRDALLIVDMHASHRGPEVKAAAHARGYEIYYIPPGCTNLLQIHDLVINKPFKGRLRAAWAKDLMNETKTKLKTKGELTARLNMDGKRARVIDWVCQAYHSPSNPRQALETQNILKEAFRTHKWIDMPVGEAMVAARAAARPPLPPPIDIADDDRQLGPNQLDDVNAMMAAFVIEEVREAAHFHRLARDDNEVRDSDDDGGGGFIGDDDDGDGEEEEEEEISDDESLDGEDDGVVSEH